MTTERDAPRIVPLAPPYDGATEAILAASMPKDSPVPPLALFRTFARDPAFTAAIGPLGRFMLSRRDKGGADFDLRSREIVILRVCARCRCEYEWGVHVASFAGKAALTEAQVRATALGGPGDDCWTAAESSLVRLVDELHDTGAVSDGVYAKVAERFGDDGMMHLFTLAGWYHAIAYLANGMGTPLEPWAPRFPGSSG